MVTTLDEVFGPSASRVVAGSRIYDWLLAELVPVVESLELGDPAQGESVGMGPMISAAGQGRVLGSLDRAQGATVLITGGGANRSRRSFVEPTIVTGVAPDSEVVRREVCGPVVPVELNAARKLPLGTVWINDHLPLVSELRHGGYRQRGYGKDISAYSLEDDTEIEHVMARLG